MHLPKPPVALDVLLDKISLLHQNLAKAPSQLEADLMKRYLQEYYAALHDWQHGLSAEGQEGFHQGGPIAELRARAPQAPFRDTAPSASKAGEEVESVTATKAIPAPPVPESQPQSPASPGAATPQPSPPQPSPAPQSVVQTPDTAPTAPQKNPASGVHPDIATEPTIRPEAESPRPSREDTGSAKSDVSEASKPESRTSPVTGMPGDYPAAVHRGEDSPSINDRFAQPENKQRSPVRVPKADSLRKHIDLNERSLFTVKLFGGNSEAYGQAIRQLDEMGDVQTALHFFDGALRHANGWNPDDRAVKHFRDLVEQHFS